jgi:hypothetical protein
MLGRGLHAAQLAPHAHRGAADLLKLPDAPRGRPRIHPRRALDGVVSKQILLHLEAVDVLGDVLQDVARCRMGRVHLDRHELHPVLHRAGLVRAVLGQEVAGDGLAHRLDGGRRHEQQQMPVGRAVLVRLGDPEAIQADAPALQVSAGLRPRLAQVLLRLPRRGAVERRVVPHPHRLPLRYTARLACIAEGQVTVMKKAACAKPRAISSKPRARASSSPRRMAGFAVLLAASSARVAA